MSRPELKPVPPPSIPDIFPPNEDFEYFKVGLEPPFKEQPGFLHWVTASWLADAALLAYNDEKQIECSASKFQQTEFLDRENTQCFLAHTDQFVIVAFRGTTILKPGANLRLDNIRGSANAAYDAFRDVLTDITVFPDFIDRQGKVHQGFNQALNPVWEQIKSLRDNSLPVWFTGHSLGGALAVLAADRYSKNGGKVGGVYTFACPVIGDENFVNSYTLQERTFRFVNNNDWLPKLKIGYQHIGRLKYIASDGSIDDKASFADSLLGHGKHLIDTVRNGDVFNLLNDDLSDHAPIYYATHIWNYYVNEL